MRAVFSLGYFMMAVKAFQFVITIVDLVVKHHVFTGTLVVNAHRLLL
jgi:hypothetical protein